MKSEFNNMEVSDYRKIQSEVAKDAYKATCHILVIKNGNPLPHGSGVFIQVDNTRFLITAAHVVDDKQDDICIGIDEHDFLTMGGDLIKNKAPGLRAEDRIDISILKLNQESIDKLEARYEFINQNELGINHEFKLDLMYTSLGFPASKSKYNPYKDEIKSRPFVYVTKPAKPAIYNELKCNGSSNLIVHYDKKKVRNYSTGELLTGPDPFGISGSGLWFTPLQEKAEHVEKKLVAILTEWPKLNRKFMLGTRIDVVTEVIRQKYNVTLERSNVVRVNL